MSQVIQAVYENGMLRPLAPLDLPENAIVEIDVRAATENVPERPNETTAQKAAQVLREAGITSQLNIRVPNVELSDDERRRLAELFSAGKPLSEIILEEREDRI